MFIKILECEYIHLYPNFNDLYKEFINLYNYFSFLDILSYFGIVNLVQLNLLFSIIFMLLNSKYNQMSEYEIRSLTCKEDI